MGSRGGEGGSFDILHLKKKRGWGKMANLCGSGGRSLSFKLEKKMQWGGWRENSIV